MSDKQTGNKTVEHAAVAREIYYKARNKIAAQVFGPQASNRPLSAEPLTADDWAKVHQAKNNFLAAIRQIVLEARCREAEEKENG